MTCPISITLDFSYFFHLCSFLLAEPRKEEWVEDMDARINCALKEGMARGMCDVGSIAVIVTGWRSGAGYTNTMRIIEVPRESEMIHVLSREKNLSKLADA